MTDYTINCDCGESFGRWKLGEDNELVKYVDVANVACGFHAGDPMIMVKTIRLAKEHGVKVGAHPGLPDLLGFGRRRMELTPDEVYASVLYQVGALKAMLDAEGMPLNHVKPHGELYLWMHRDGRILDAVIKAVQTFKVPMFGLPQDDVIQKCSAAGVPLVKEFYVDIDYDDNKALMGVPRSNPVNATIISRRVADMVRSSTAIAQSGKQLSFDEEHRPTSICIHSDLPGAVDNAIAARKALDGNL